MDVRWQVEIDPWARQVLAKHWPDVRRHDDIKTWPKPDTERVDVICGGFPCQDISTAGKGAGLAGARSGLFYEAMRVVRDLEPRYILLENVSALLVRGMDSVLAALAQVGMDAVWHCVTAAHVGAPHRRDRIFIIGYRPEAVADTKGGLLSGINGRPESGIRFAECRQAVADTNRDRCDENGERKPGESGATRSKIQLLADTESERREEGRGVQHARTEERATGRRSYAEWWATEPDVGRVANGVPRRVDRLRGLGNAVVPQVAEFVGHLLLDIHRGKIPAPRSSNAGGTVSPLRGAYSLETEKDRWQEDHQQMTR